MKMPPNTGGDFTPPPSGTHLAICYRVIDLGTQQVEWQGQTKRQRKIMLSWELAEEPMEDGQPFTVHQRYTFSSHERSIFRQHLEAWRGRAFTEAELCGGEGGFEIKNVLGVPCLLTIIHEDKNGRTYANIKGISKLPKGMNAPLATNGAVYLSLERGEFDKDVFESLSDGLKTIIQKSPEYAEATMGAQVSDAPPPAHQGDGYDDLNDSVPF